MARLSYINTETNSNQEYPLNIPTDESICAILIDIGGFENPFDGFPLIFYNFQDNQVQRITNMDEAELLGITNNSFLNGLLYHHLSQYYSYLGSDQPLYIMLADCSKDWDAVQLLHQQISGREFQIGIWTSQPIWNFKEDGSIGFAPLIKELQGQADEINGFVGKRTHTMTPISIILNANSNNIEGEDINYKNLPDAKELECPKVSLFLLQNGSTEIKSIQDKNPNKTPVGALGLILACVSLCGAEKSIAAVGTCDLNKNEGFNYPEWGVGLSGTPIDTVNRIWANLISEKGYIVPIDYEGEEASYFFSSDQTLSNGDYSTLANNRIMHKVRRTVCSALLPYVGSDQIYDPGTKTLHLSAITMITASINTALDSVMMNREGQKQLESRSLTFLQDDDLLETDSFSVKLEIKPAGSNTIIEEEVSHDIVS